MSTSAINVGEASEFPVRVEIEPMTARRNRLTTAFRFILALPHVLLVGGPIALFVGSGSGGQDDSGASWGAAGVLGAVAFVCAFLAWFAIVFTGRHPDGLWNLAAFYLRWRVRAVAYTTLLRDEYPPFGDGAYPATLELPVPERPRDRMTVAFRLILVIPHLIVIALLAIAWAVTSIIAWFAILFTGRFPESLYRFGVGVLQWNIRVEAYVLLLRDEYPPFSFE